MPLFIVHWSSDTATIVSSDDEQMLLDILGERALGPHLSWQVYDGPLWLDINTNDGLHTFVAASTDVPATYEPEIATDDVGITWDDALTALEIARDAWIEALNLTQLCDALRSALDRLDVAEPRWWSTCRICK